MFFQNCAPQQEDPKNETTAQKNPEAGPALSYRKFLPKGAHPSWYRGTAENHDLIAYEAPYDTKATDPENSTTGNTEVFIISPNGGARVCVTCNDVKIPKGFIGQPSWHPDGEFLVLQAENLANSTHSDLNKTSRGINQDLWIIKSDGTQAEMVFQAPTNGGALRPQFNKDGTKLIFSERAGSANLSNPWTGWKISICDFSLAGLPGSKLGACQSITTYGSSGFYGLNCITDAGDILFSRTFSGKDYIDEIWKSQINGSNKIPVVSNSGVWDDRGCISPDQKTFIYSSSSFDTGWMYPGSNQSTLKTELFIFQKSDLTYENIPNYQHTRLTYFNGFLGASNKRFLVNDFDWSRDSRRIVFESQAIPLDGSAPTSELWLLFLP